MFKYVYIEEKKKRRAIVIDICTWLNDIIDTEEGINRGKKKH